MLVYANSFELEPEDGVHSIIHLIGRWLRQKTRVSINLDKLSHGIRELKFDDGSLLSSKSSQVNSQDDTHPYLFSVRYTHPDFQISGRRWTTEIGVRQIEPGARIECSILLRTDEISTKITAPIMVTRPKLVVDLVEFCRPVGGTPGAYPKKLTVDSAPAFERELDRQDRKHPYVVMSVGDDGRYAINPERLRSLLLGLADIVVIPKTESTTAIEHLLGRRYTPYGGAIKVIFPKRGRRVYDHYETRLFASRAGESEPLDDQQLAAAILTEITHRSNIRESWRHISQEVVEESILRRKLYQALASVHNADVLMDIHEYQALLEEADLELRAKEGVIKELQLDLEDKSSEVYRAMASVESLRKTQFTRGSDTFASASVPASIITIREGLKSLQDETLGLEQALTLIANLYPDRIVVLESAIESARQSDRGHFQYAQKAHELLNRLACEYWPIMADGGTTQQAKAVFTETTFSATETNLSAEGKRLRTFIYKGQQLRMDTHLRYGVKNSKATTLRIHFEWIGGDQKIVIGHCGKHLDF
ncbi:hypothetical protein [Pseudomonas sp. S1(2024)]|uniref:hypothetical protein n=1 Tax=Pseudomonas sp. S1(2024) TaxID=3390191 RepID=UPI0039788B38